MHVAATDTFQAAAHGLLITVLESSANHLLVRWVESGRCHYGEQRWRLGVATRTGYCAVSGRKIHRGDAVYRPTGRPPPANRAAMITMGSFPLSIE
ncbi:hypothetical protein LMG24238_07363 [Paraburkholderia sediminicola]|uniref:DUF3331 domain-containing protein n=1 Tax=Paraburkholderia sediminicola TaxID=458836 RepID=A0A6J5CSH9_9BURK|nr:DUF3331 domain-containing protein [Paraburkholderia sediminicola]CAB3744866.1 hypothetical protein LMG24238_07363 [Paraburkholderia sediminicola]